MKSEEKARSKAAELISKGVVLLILLILAVQFIYFIIYAVRDARRPEGGSEAVRVDTVYIVRTDTVYIYENKGKWTGGNNTAAEERKRSADNSGRQVESAEKYVHDGWKWDRVELNSADSAALDDLPGIGPYYAKQILRYRDKLWGRFHDVRQLMEIRGIDGELLAKIEPRIYIESSGPQKYDLYTMCRDSLAMHPYIGSYAADNIERFRNMLPRAEFSIDTLVGARVITQAQAQRIAVCFK